jgi:DNA-binding YbaB/EbfC family protein
MLGNIGQLMQLMKNAGQIKQNMAQVNERLSAARYAGQAGGGQVEATVDGRGEFVKLRIDPQLVQAGDVEMLEDLICAATRDAVRLSREGTQKEMEAAMGGINLGGMMDMLGGPKP